MGDLGFGVLSFPRGWVGKMRALMMMVVVGEVEEA
jgi:hypothetical protein